MIEEDSDNVAKVLLKKDNKYLILIRTDNGRFDLPGGKCHIGEGFENGAFREVDEETSLQCEELKEVISTSKKKVFLCETFRGDIILDKRENFNFIWLDREHIFDLTIKNCTDVIVASQAFLLSDPKSYSKLR